MTPTSNWRRRPAARPLTSSHPDPVSFAPSIRHGNCLWSSVPPSTAEIIGVYCRGVRIEHGGLDDLDGEGLEVGAREGEVAMRRHDRAQEAAVGHELALDGLALEPGPRGRDADGAVHRGGDAEGEGRQRAQEVKVKGVEDLHVLAPGDLVRPAAELEPGHMRRPGAGELGQGEDAEVLPPELAVRLETRIRGTQKQTFGGGQVIELGRKSSTRQTWIQKGENVVVDGWGGIVVTSLDTLGSGLASKPRNWWRVGMSDDRTLNVDVGCILDRQAV
ncbi:hypothetical protein BJ166DRAFT_501335 [Pestalotiopsis sp. NC0098]|nr:hypothetical protein BJ166DRAFT_501335 [Pestalotiopsis sp. NC0098]